MRHPIAYTFLGFHFNSLVDQGSKLDLQQTHDKIRRKELFPWLKEKFDNSLDISLFSQTDLDKVESFFESMSSAVNEKRKFGVTENGLCLLVAYCFEAAQRSEKDLI